MNIEKPSRKKRKQQEELLRDEVNKYRKQNRYRAYERDDGICAICFFKENKRKKADDIHHVYGRAITKNVLTSEKELYVSLLCLCREHHNSIDAVRKNGSSWEWVEEVLNKANATPINKEFIHG